MMGFVMLGNVNLLFGSEVVELLLSLLDECPPVLFLSSLEFIEFPVEILG